MLPCFNLHFKVFQLIGSKGMDALMILGMSCYIVFQGTFLFFRNFPVQKIITIFFNHIEESKTSTI